jgi:hypothetical protein
MCVGVSDVEVELSPKFHKYESPLSVQFKKDMEAPVSTVEEDGVKHASGSF